MVNRSSSEEEKVDDSSAHDSDQLKVECSFCKSLVVIDDLDIHET